MPKGTKWSRTPGRRRGGIASVTTLAICAILLTACETERKRAEFFTSARQKAALVDTPPTQPPGTPYGPRAEPGAAREIAGFTERGSGQLVQTSLAPTQLGRVQLAEIGTGEFTLNFADADLREVIRTMLQDVLEANYTVDPRIQGTVTLQTSRPLGRDQVLPTLEEILRLNGAAIVESGGLFRIVPLEEAGKTAPNLSFDDIRGRGLSVRVIPLRFVAASEIESLLQAFTSVAGGLTIDSSRNLVFVAGTRQELSNLSNLVAVLDVDWMKGMSFALKPLTSTGPDTMITELEQILLDPAGPNLGNLLRFVPIERMNAVLIVAKQPRYLDEALRWIARLDQGGIDQQRLHVYYVQNRRASDLAEVLGQVFGVETSILGDTTSSLAPGLTPVTLATEGAPEGGPEAEAIPSPPPVGGGAPAPEGTTLGGLGEVRIIADQESNSLVTLASATDYRTVLSALKQLDILPLQVLIEATIAEVTLSDELDFGLRYFFQAGDNEFSFSDFADGAVGAIFPGFNYVFANSDATVALNALKEITDVNVLSAPSIVVLDNQTGKLEVGDQVPVTTRSSVSSTDSEAPPVNEVDQRDTGVILTVTPRVNAGGLVILEVVQEVSDAVETTTSNIDSPTIQQRKLESTIAIQSGATVALGGLVRDRISETTSGIPLLMDIPLLGNLFKTRSNEKDRVELLVLLRPRVIRNSEDARALTEELRSRLPGIFPPEEEPDPEEAEEGAPAGT